MATTASTKLRVVVDTNILIAAASHRNEDEEREFWWNLDLSEYFEPEDLVPVSFPDLKPTNWLVSKRKPAPKKKTQSPS